MSQITVAYWNVRGLAEPIRYLLHYKQVKFEDKRYQWDTDDWINEKYHLELEFPNMPYYIDDDVKLTQSSTILRYLARKYDLDGNAEQQKLRISLVEQQIIDMRRSLNMAAVKKNFEESRPQVEKNAAGKWKEFVAFLGDNEFLVGDEVTYVDFMMLEILDFYRYFSPPTLDAFPTLKAHQKRIKNLPELRDYLNSSTFKKWPIYGPNWSWGGSGDEPNLD